MAFRYRCPQIDCRKTFPWESTSDPVACPHCGYSYRKADDPDDEVVMPNIMSAKTKSIEAVARGVMDGSEARVQLAAEAAGCDPSEMAGLKVTNLNDGRQSEFATRDVVNPVTQVMAQTPGLSGFQAQGAAFAAGTRVGPNPNAGAKVVTGISNRHAQLVQTLAVSGKRG